MRARRMMAVTALLLGALLVLAGCSSEPAGGGAAGEGGAAPASAKTAGGAGGTLPAVTAQGAPPNTVTASGQGRASATPDRAQLSFGATVSRDDAARALSDSSAKARTIAQAIRKAGVEGRDIQTSQVSLYPQNDGSGRITGYQASIQVQVRMREIGLAGKVIAAATDAGATDVGGPSLYLSAENAANGKALQAAYADAKARAEVMAKAAGKTLGDVVSISEGGGGVSPVWAADSSRLAKGMESVPIEPGTSEVQASLVATFELR